MPGIKSVYTQWTADWKIQYAKDRWAIAYVFFPDGPCKGVIIDGHGGGWIAISNVSDWLFDPTHEILDKAQTDLLLADGWAVVWMEYPRGWQTSATARIFPESRFPYIPRIAARCKQFIQTHALDGYITRSRALTFPIEDFRYILKGNSAGAISLLWAALQRDGYLSYDPTGRANDMSPYAYTRSARVGGLWLDDCATDLRRYGLSAALLPYIGWAGKLYSDSSSGGVANANSDRLDTVEVDWKGALSPYVSADTDYLPNLDVGIFISNAIALNEATYLTSGMTIRYDEAELTGTPQVNDVVTAAGGSVGTLKYHDTGNNLLHIDTTSGTVAQWTGALSFSISGAAVSTAGNLEHYGNDAYPEALSEADLLAIWDADDLPVAGVTEHQCAYLPAFKRMRAQRFSDAGRSSIDRIYCGTPYVANVLSSGFYGPAFPWIQQGEAGHFMDWSENTLGIA